MNNCAKFHAFITLRAISVIFNTKHLSPERRPIDLMFDSRCLSTGFKFLPMRRYASVGLCESYVFVHLSHAGIVSKRRKLERK